MKLMKRTVALIMVLMLLTGCDLLDRRPGVTREWRLMEKSAVGTTVNLYAWGGDEAANRWFDETLKPYLADTYKITLNRIPMNYDEIFGRLASDMENKRSIGDIDLLWISGRNFEYAKNQNYLFGPVASRLPNVGLYLDPKDPEFLKDRGVELGEYAVPLGRRQMVLFYNEDVIYDPPLDLDGLMGIAKENPGKFTYPVPESPVGMAFIESVIYGKAGKQALENLPPNKEAVAAAIQPGLEYLKALEPYLLNKGATYPADEAELDRLFTAGTLDMAMSMDHNHATRLLAEDLYNPGAKPFLPESGTVGSTHYLSIPYNAANKSGAMVVINAALDVDMQAAKFRPTDWGDIPVLDPALLPADAAKTLKRSVSKKTSPKLEELDAHRLPQLPPAIEALIAELWHEQIAP